MITSSPCAKDCHVVAIALHDNLWREAMFMERLYSEVSLWPYIWPRKQSRISIACREDYIASGRAACSNHACCYAAQPQKEQSTQLRNCGLRAPAQCRPRMKDGSIFSKLVSPSFLSFLSFPFPTISDILDSHRSHNYGSHRQICLC
jgi:hypothetical protein